EGVSLRIDVLLPGNFRDEPWTFLMSGAVALDHMSDLDSRKFGFGTEHMALPPSFLSLDSAKEDALTLRFFEVSFDPRTRSIPSIKLDVSMRASCELIHGLELADPRLWFTAMNPFNKLELTGALSGTIAVGDLGFWIEAEKLANGWAFTGK